MSSFAAALAGAGLVGSRESGAENAPDSTRSVPRPLSGSAGSAVVKLTPGEAQICALKLGFPGAILLVESGYRFRLYGPDAVFAAGHLGIVAHLDRAGGGKLMAAGVPIHRIGVHVRRLVHGQGCVVAVVRQAETAAAKAAGMAADGKKSGPFARALAGLYSPSTLAADDVVAGIETGAAGNAFIGGNSSSGGGGRGGAGAGGRGRGRGGFWQAAARGAAARRGGGHSLARPARTADAGADIAQSADDSGDDDRDEARPEDAGGSSRAPVCRGAPSQALAGNPLPLLVYVEGAVPLPCTADSTRVAASAALKLPLDADDVVEIDSDSDSGGEAAAATGAAADGSYSVLRASALLSIDVASLAVRWDAWLWADGPAAIDVAGVGTVASDPQRIALASRLAGLDASEIVTAGSSTAAIHPRIKRGFSLSLSDGSAETLLKFAAASSPAATAGDASDSGSQSAVRGLLGLGPAPNVADLAGAQAAAELLGRANGADAAAAGSESASSAMAGGSAGSGAAGGLPSLGKFAAAATAKVAAARSTKKPAAGSSGDGAALQSSSLPFICANPAIVSYAWQLPLASSATAASTGSSASASAAITAAAAPTGGATILARSADGLAVVTTGAEMRNASTDDSGSWWDYDSGGGVGVGSPDANADDGSPDADADLDDSGRAPRPDRTAAKAASLAPAAKRPRKADVQHGAAATAAPTANSSAVPSAAKPPTHTTAGGSKASNSIAATSGRAAAPAAGKASISHYFGSGSSSVAAAASKPTSSSAKAAGTAGATGKHAPAAPAVATGVKRARPASAAASQSASAKPDVAAAKAAAADDIIVLDSSSDDEDDGKTTGSSGAGAGANAASRAKPTAASDKPAASVQMEALAISLHDDAAYADSAEDAAVAATEAIVVPSSCAPTHRPRAAQPTTRRSVVPRAKLDPALLNASMLSLAAPPPPRPARILMHVVPAALVTAQARLQAAGTPLAPAVRTGPAQSSLAVENGNNFEEASALSAAVSAAAASAGVGGAGVSLLALQHAASAASLFLLPFGKADALARATWARMAAGADTSRARGAAADIGAGAGTGSALLVVAGNGDHGSQASHVVADSESSMPTHMAVTSATLSDIGVLPLRQSRAGAAAAAGGGSTALSSAAAAAGLVGLYDRFAATAAGRRVVADWLTRPLAIGSAVRARLAAVDALCGRRVLPVADAGMPEGNIAAAASLSMAHSAGVLGAHATPRLLSALAHVILERINSSLQPPPIDDDLEDHGDHHDDGGGAAEDDDDRLRDGSAAEAPAPRSTMRRRKGGRWGRGSGSPVPDLHALAGRLLQGRATPAQVAAAFGWLSRLGSALCLLLPKSPAGAASVAATTAGARGRSSERASCLCGARQSDCCCTADPLRAAVEPIVAAACLPLSKALALTSAAGATSIAAAAPQRNTLVIGTSSRAGDSAVIAIDDDNDDDDAHHPNGGLGSGYVAGPASLASQPEPAGGLLRYLRADAPLPAAVLGCLPGIGSALPSLGSSSSSTAAAAVEADENGEQAGAAPPLPLRADIAEALQPSLARWRSQHAAANAGLVDELARVRRVLGKPSLQWTRLRTGINSVLECLVEIKKSEMDAGALRPLRLPSGWSEVSATKVVRRYRTPGVAALLQQRELACDMIAKDAAAAWTRWQQEVLGRYVVPQLLLPAAEGIARLDALAAFACVSSLPGYCRPVVWDRDAALPFIRIHEGRHPVLEHAGRASVVANSAVELAGSAAAAVIDDDGRAAISPAAAGASTSGAGGAGSSFTYIPSSLALGPLPAAIGDTSSRASDAAVGSSGHLDGRGAHSDDAATGSDSEVSCTDAAAAVSPPCLTVTGPNAAGKSMAVRMLACLVVQAQAGSYVAAEAMQLAVLDALHTRMGSADAIVAGFSSFALEMRTAASMLSNSVGANDAPRRDVAAVADSGVPPSGSGSAMAPGAARADHDDSLVARSRAHLPRPLLLFDELGRATSTRDGAAIATATLRYCARPWLRAGLPCYPSGADSAEADVELTADSGAPPRFLPLCVFVTHFPQLARLPEAVPTFSRVVGNAHPAFLVEGADGASEGGAGASGDGAGAGAATVSAGSHVSGTGSNEASSSGGRLTFLYRLADGAAPSSYGLAVARLAGLPAGLVGRAEHYSRLHPGHGSSAGRSDDAAAGGGVP